MVDLIAPVAPRTRDASAVQRIELAPYDLGAALALERELGISHVLAQILVRRGYGDARAARQFLEPAERYDATGFAEIDRTLALIGEHVKARSRIVVHGDYDADGVCATAVMVRALRCLGAEPEWYLPSRTEDGYGLSSATVQRLARRGTQLLITVDCGITGVEAVAEARAAGIDVIVTDHHAPRADGRLPDCAIVHPALGGHPSTHLCGTGVAHKLAEALGAASASEDLELVALATVADLMPLRGENRRLVREGLAQLACTQKPGLRALIAVARADPSALDATCLGFRLAPRINAAGRMRRADAALELLLTDDPSRAAEVAEELDRLSTERRAVEQRITWEAEALAAELGERSAYVLAAEGWHPGVIGIVASRIVERLHRPAILIALDRGEETRPAAGSGRSIPGFDLLAALDSASGLLTTYGGHRAAAGLTVAPDRIGALRDAIERHAEAVLTPELLERVQHVDAVASAGELTLELAEELLALEPCGIGNPGAKLLIPGARFDSVREMGDGKHARFQVHSGGASASAVAFGCDGRPAGADGAPVDACFRLERNTWNGIVEPRLVLAHAAPCAPPQITVLGEPDSYLGAVLAELERPLVDAPAGRPASGPGAPETTRVVLDRRGESPLAVLADALAAAGGEPVLAVCADVARRLPGLRDRTGGFALVSHAGLAADTGVVESFAQIVVLDPAADPGLDEVLRWGEGFTHLAWGEAELRFAQQMHELQYDLRSSLVALYRDLRERGRVAGEELERLLRGSGDHARPAGLAGRLVRVLTELGLVSLDRDLPALAMGGVQATELERSSAYREYTKVNEEGQRFLSRATPRPSG